MGRYSKRAIPSLIPTHLASSMERPARSRDTACEEATISASSTLTRPRSRSRIQFRRGRLSRQRAAWHETNIWHFWTQHCLDSELPRDEREQEKRHGHELSR